MQASFLYLFCFGLLASATASVVRRPTGTKNGPGLKLSDIGATFEGKNSGHYPELKEPTKEEWIEIIKGTLDDDAMHQSNFTLQANDTGSFSDSMGNKGVWTATAYVRYRFKEEQTSRSMMASVSMKLAGVSYAMGQISEFFFTDAGHEVVVAAGVDRKASFLVHKDDTYDLLEMSLGFSEGIESPGPDNRTRVHSHILLRLTNTTNIFTMSASEVGAMIISNKDHCSYNGTIGGNKLPLSGTQVGVELSQTPDDLAQMLKADSAEISTMFGIFFGDYTIGKTGIFNAGTNTSTFLSKGVYNFTSSLHGHYAEIDDPETHNKFSLLDMIYSMANRFF